MTRTLRVVVAFSAIAAAGAAVYFALGRKTAPKSTVRVGVDHSPPFYSIEPDGSVRGLAVDVLNEAARRSGIRIIWTPLHDIPLDDALEQRKVQLWPLVGATPERRKKFFLTRPWLESDYVLVSRQDHPLRNAEDAAGKVISHARLKLTTMLAKQYLSRSTLIVRLFRSDAIQAVCSGEADASLVESRVLDAILLTRPAGCEKINFHISSLPGATSPLSIAAVPEVREAALALRDEITRLTHNGFLSAKLDEWSPFSAEGTRSIWAQEAADQRSRIYRYCLILILLLATVLAWVAFRASSLKQAAERAESGRRDAQRRFTAFMDHSPAIAFMKDTAGRMLYVNRAWSQMFGRTLDQCYGKDDFELWPHKTASILRSNDVTLLQDDKPRQMIEEVPGPGAERRDFLVIKFPFANEKGERFLGGTGIDITEREAAARALAASESRYRELFERNPLPAWVCDRATLRFLTVNDAAIARYGWTREDFLSGMTLSDILSPDESRPAMRDAAAMDWAHRQPSAWRHRTKDGLVLSVDVTSYELEYEHRRSRLMIVRDLTEQERTLEQLRLSEERWQLALRGAGDALWDWDLISGTVFRSPGWRAMLGYGEGAIGNTREDFLQLLHPDDVEPTSAAVDAHLARRTPAFAAEYRLRHRDGTWRWIVDRGQAVWDERGRPIRMAGSHRDITERRNAQDLLSMQARTDALTGLANRREFEKLFTEQVLLARRTGARLSVCICDLDCFKQVNDSYGHAAGDRVLIAFGDILRQNFRKSDLLARIGGDEFVLALPGRSVEEACVLVERIREQLNSAKFEVNNKAFHVSGSFGVSELRAAHVDGNELIAEADRFLYNAKESGRNRTLAAA